MMHGAQTDHGATLHHAARKKGTGDAQRYWGKMTKKLRPGGKLTKKSLGSKVKSSEEIPQNYSAVSKVATDPGRSYGKKTAVALQYITELGAFPTSGTWKKKKTD